MSTTGHRPRRRAALLATSLVLGLLAVVPLTPSPAAAAVGQIAFPVAGGASWSDTFGAPRSGGRSHAGQDLFAPKMRALVAAADGVVVRMGRDSGISGNYVVIEDAYGWEYLYIHVNNDRPGTDDGANLDLDAFPPGIRPGAQVFSGQTIGYLGDSGNAETTPPHVHFEIHTPDGTPVNPADLLRGAAAYTLDPSLVRAHSPFGVWDQVLLAPGGFEVTGWSMDPDSTTSLAMEHYVDRELTGTFAANLARPDLLPLGKGALHGYKKTVPVGDGQHDVCLAARNDERGPAGWYGCTTVARSTSPIGALDGVRRVPGGLAVHGWSIDSDTDAPVDVHVYAGSTGVPTVANQVRGDLTSSFPRFSAQHGFTATVPASAGRHQVCAYGINTVGSGGTTLLRCTAVDVSSNPIGRIDVARGGPGGISLAGWALDPDTAAATDIHVYVDGVGTNLGPANQSRGDIGNAYPEWGAAHGFSATIPTSTGGDHQVCAYAINRDAGSNVLLGCTVVRTPSGPPTGSLDAVTRTAAGEVRVQGWSIDPDTALPVDVHVYAGSLGTNLGPASLPRADLAAHYPGYGVDHGFDRHIPAPAGPVSVCAYGIDRVGGQAPTLLGCRTV